MGDEDDEGEDYRTTIVIPKSLQKAVAHYCIDKEMTFTNAVIEALEEYMRKHAAR